MNYGQPDDDKPMRVSGGAGVTGNVGYGGPVGVTLPIHEQVRQSRAALCGMVPSVEPDEPKPWTLTPLLTDESTARCVETSNEDKKAELHYRSATVAAMEALARERDDLARRCADLENERDSWRAERALLWANRARLQADFDDLRRLGVALPTESPKAQGSHTPVAPADPPHGTPAALGDLLPEPARLNESIPGSAALHDARPVSAKPAPGPMPANALRHAPKSGPR